jgi:hypothetical protein
MDGCSPTKAKVLARQVLGDINEALGALEGFYEFVDQLPGSGLELVGLRANSRAATGFAASARH